MAWFILVIGILLIAVGVGGQIFGIRKKTKLAPFDRPARRWILTIGSIVAGLWIVGVWASYFLKFHTTGHW